MTDDAQRFNNISATTAAFALKGGKYAMNVSATFGGGTVKLQQQAGDGSTFVDLLAPFNNAGTEADLVIGSFAAAGMKVFDLPAGVFKVVIATASAVYVSIARVPLI